ncbi:hypothetical protein VDGL01_08617 [Verticillium dahliae]
MLTRRNLYAKAAVGGNRLCDLVGRSTRSGTSSQAAGGAYTQPHSEGSADRILGQTSKALHDAPLIIADEAKSAHQAPSLSLFTVPHPPASAETPPPSAGTRPHRTGPTPCLARQPPQPATTPPSPGPLHTLHAMPPNARPAGHDKCCLRPAASDQSPLLRCWPLAFSLLPPTSIGSGGGDSV